MCEKLQLKFMKLVLNVRSSTPTCMVLGELGKFPVSIDAKCRLLTFWYRLCTDIQSGSNKISTLMLRLCQSLYNNTDYKIPWLKSVRSLLDQLGLSYIWFDTYNVNLTVDQFKLLIKQRFHDQFLQYWMSEVYLNSICISYRIFKVNFGFEDYLIRLSPSLRRNFLNFRCQHRLPIQLQRYVDTPREERICLLCDGREVGDEFHYLFKCTYPLLKDSRKNLIPKYFQHHPNALKFCTLMNSNSGKLTKLCRFIKTILSLF